MSEKIVAGNLDEVIGKNVEIRDEMREKALLIRTIGIECKLVRQISWQCRF